MELYSISSERRLVLMVVFMVATWMESWSASTCSATPTSTDRCVVACNFSMFTRFFSSKPMVSSITRME